MRLSRIAVQTAAALLATGAALPAHAQSWTDWQASLLSSGVTKGFAAGTLDVGSQAVGVAYTGDLYSTTQTACGASYWSTNSSVYTNPTAGLLNAPPPCDIVTMIGGAGRPSTQTISFSTPVTNPVFAILGLGQSGIQASFDFDRPFTVENSGPGYYGGETPSLFDDGLVGGAFRLRGVEGHGLIRFAGPVSSISWTTPTAETWYGFTVGTQGATLTTPEPASLALVAAGTALGGLVASRRRRSDRGR